MRCLAAPLSLLALSVASLVACADLDDGSSSAPRSSSSPSSSPSSSSPASPSAPPPSSSSSSGSGFSESSGPFRVVSVSATAPALTLYPVTPRETTKTEIVAIVTHTEGSEHIAGGQLMDEEGHVFGAFQAAANKGTLTLALDWFGLSAVAPLTVSKGEKKAFVARFFDSSGRTVQKSVELQFQCRVVSGALRYPLPAALPPEGIPTGAFEGKCFDDAHCGKNGVACGEGTSCSVRTESCENVVGTCVDREEFPWLASADCACPSSRCTTGECSCVR